MDDSLLMCVLDGLANRNEQLDALPHCEALGIAVTADRDAINHLHHEVGQAGGSGPGVEHPGPPLLGLAQLLELLLGRLLREEAHLVAALSPARGLGLSGLGVGLEEGLGLGFEVFEGDWRAHVQRLGDG